MNVVRKIEVFGDSILKGIQLNPFSKKYQVDNHIGIDALSSRFSLQIENRSKFGCTLGKGYELLRKFLDSGFRCDAVVMDFGGNDCDFDWKAVSEDPTAEHSPHTPLALFVELYQKAIELVRRHGIVPILTTLPPLVPQRFFDWFCGKYNRENILSWLGDINAIYRYQENYSRTVGKIAQAAAVPLVDLRGVFLRHRRIEGFFCEDGTHPNTEGQKLITGAFLEFAETMLV